MKGPDDWIITGPSRLPPSAVRDIRRALSSLDESPLAKKAALSAPDSPVGETSEESALETMAPAAQTTPVAPSFPPPRDLSRLQALRNRHKSGAVEVSPSGDIVHYVTTPSESLPAIALWYTDEAENAARLARINGLRPSSVLSAGDTVVIPSYMVSFRSRPADEAWQQLPALLAEDGQMPVTGQELSRTMP